jgi:hypothetical protein
MRGDHPPVVGKVGGPKLLWGAKETRGPRDGRVPVFAVWFGLV